MVWGIVRTVGYAERRLHLGNKNKRVFILYFARFALPLQTKLDIPNERNTSYTKQDIRDTWA